MMNDKSTKCHCTAANLSREDFGKDEALEFDTKGQGKFDK